MNRNKRFYSWQVIYCILRAKHLLLFFQIISPFLKLVLLILVSKMIRMIDLRRRWYKWLLPEDVSHLWGRFMKHAWWHVMKHASRVFVYTNTFTWVRRRQHPSIYMTMRCRDERHPMLALLDLLVLYITLHTSIELS